MRIFFLKFNLAILAVIVVAALFLSAIFLGFRAGRAKARAGSVYATVLELGKGLNNFFSDQDRFPSSQEFLDTNILLMYFSGLPNNLSANSVCSENFIYKKLDLNSYQLNFCLAADFGGYNKGWNSINEQK